MIGKVHLLNTTVVNLLHFGVAPPENAIAEGGRSLLLACVVDLRPQVIFVGWFEVYGALLKLIKEQLHVGFISGFFFEDGLTWSLLTLLF